METSFDDATTKMFIGLVEKHPELWDGSFELYHDKKKRLTAWQAICTTMNKGKKRNVTVSQLTNRWKRLRENFTRNQQRNSKSGRPCNYVHAEAMSFLAAPRQSSAGKSAQLTHKPATPTSQSFDKVQHGTRPVSRSDSFELSKTEDVNVPMLINMVQHYPEIWDMFSKHYKDKDKKLLAWEDVATSLYAGFEQRSQLEKSAIVKRLTNRWKNLRDNYTKSLKRMKTKSEQGEPAREYIYADKLSFLGISDTSDNLQCFENGSGHFLAGFPEAAQYLEEGDGPVNVRSDSPILITDSPVKVRPSDGFNGGAEENLTSASVKAGAAPAASSTPPAKRSRISLEFDDLDEDRAFFESLLPTVKKFSDDEKLDFRSDVLEVIRSIKRRQPR